MKISIIIPCYNEEKRILNTLKKIKEYIEKKRNWFEVIAIDDGSSDKTVDVIKNFDLKIKILKNMCNKGKGYSVRKGMLESKGDVSLFMDADSSTDINEFDEFMPFLNDYDIIIGSRAISKEKIIIPQGFIRRNMGLIAHKLINFVLKINIKDTMCGFKAYNKKTKEFLFKKQLVERWGFDYEILFLAKKYNFKIKEIPIEWKNNSDSKVTVKGYLKALNELFIIRLNDFLGKYKVRMGIDHK